MPKENPDYITTCHLGNGWAAIHCRWYADLPGYDCYQTGASSHATEAEAIKDAEYWSDAEGMEYRPAKSAAA